MLQEDNKVAKPKLPEETEKRKIKPKKVVLLVLFAILALAILIAIGIAIIGLIQNPTNTFIVENGTLSSEENAVGYVLRDETVVQGQNYKNGMEKLKTEGEKVAKGEITSKEAKLYLAGHLGYIKIANVKNLKEKLFY